MATRLYVIGLIYSAYSSKREYPRHFLYAMVTSTCISNVSKKMPLHDDTIEEKYTCLNTRFNGDRSDLLDNLGGGVQVDQALVNSHLELIKGLGTVTTRRLAGGDAQNLGWQADRTLDLELLVFGTLNEISRHYVV